MGQPLRLQGQRAPWHRGKAMRISQVLRRGEGVREPQGYSSLDGQLGSWCARGRGDQVRRPGGSSAEGAGTRQGWEDDAREPGDRAGPGPGRNCQVMQVREATEARGWGPDPGGETFHPQDTLPGDPARGFFPELIDSRLLSIPRPRPQSGPGCPSPRPVPPADLSRCPGRRPPGGRARAVGPRGAAAARPAIQAHILPKEGGD